MGAATTEVTLGLERDEPTFPDSPVGRLERQAHSKDVQCEELLDAGDEEGAHIARVEAEELRGQAQGLDDPAESDGASVAELNAGPAVGEMPPAADPDDFIEPEEIIVAGLDISPAALGGKAPQSGVLTLTGAKATLAQGTFLKKGMKIGFSGVAVVNEVSQKDHHDPTTSQVTGAEQKHKARVLVLDVQLPQEAAGK